MPPTISHLDGIPVGTGTQFSIGIPIGQETGYSTELSLRPRRDATPTFQGKQFNARTIPFIVYRGTGAAADDQQWQEDVYKFFGPFRDIRVLRALHHGLSVEVGVYITDLHLRSGSAEIFDGVMTVPDPVWRAAATSAPVTTSPVTVVGSFRAQPLITITPSATQIKHVVISITDPFGRGLANYPIRAVLDTSAVGGLGASDFILYYRQQAIPFNIQGPSTATTKLDFRVDVDPGGTVTVDVFYGAAINNTVTANKYDDAGMDLTHASFANTLWVWKNDFVALFNNAPLTGAWVPMHAFANPLLAGMTFGVGGTTTPGIKQVASVQFAVAASGGTVMPNDFDAIVLTVGGEAGATNALRGFTVNPNTNEGKVRYRKAGEYDWRDATAVPQGGGFTWYDLDGAVQIAIGVEWSTTAGVTISQTGADTPMRLVIDTPPTVVVGAATNANIVKATIANTTNGKNIYLDLIITATSLIVDTLGKSIYQSDGTPYFGSVRVSDPVDWLPLEVGANTWAVQQGGGDPGTFTTQFEWKERYVA